MSVFRVEIEGEPALAFDCPAQQTVLAAAMAAGIELPYSCRKGVCETCRGGLVRGALLGAHGERIEAPPGDGAQTTASQPQASQPQAPVPTALLCVCHPASDLLIRPRSARRLEPGARKRLSAKVYRAMRAADDVTVLQLRFAAGVRARFRAGQYLEIVLADGARRSFSMANPPHENDGVLLHIRHVPGGRFTGELLPSIAPGDRLEVELPFGDFCLREGDDRPIVFVAGGTGFAPIKSIIDSAIRGGVRRPMALYWGARRPDGLYAPEVIERWRRQIRALRVCTVVSEPYGTDWSGERGLVHEAVLRHEPDLSSVVVYACGAPAMIDAARTAFGAAGLPADAFFADVFATGPAPP